MTQPTTLDVAARPPGLRRLWSDTVVMTKRNLLKYVRVPTLLVFSTVQPVVFVLLFVFVFGGAINISGIDFTNYLMAGVFAQASVFGSTNTGVGLAEDINKGLIERFRSLPMSRAAVLLGRTASDAGRNTFVVILMTIVGYLVGFEFQAGPVRAVLALLLAVLLGYAFSWISAWIGLSVGDVESAQASTFVWVFPITFASSAFVPTQTFPGWLEAFANVNPITIVVNAIRALVLGDPPPLAAWEPLFPNLWFALLWIGAILVVFIPLAVRAYRKAV